MTLGEYADTIKAAIHLLRYPMQNNRWICALADITRKNGNDDAVHAETKADMQDCLLAGTYGDSKSPEGAIQDYVSKIKGKIVVITRWDKEYKRETYGVPETLIP